MSLKKKLRRLRRTFKKSQKKIDSFFNNTNSEKTKMVKKKIYKKRARRSLLDKK